MKNSTSLSLKSASLLSEAPRPGCILFDISMRKEQSGPIVHCLMYDVGVILSMRGRRVQNGISVAEGYEAASDTMISTSPVPGNMSNGIARVIR